MVRDIPKSAKNASINPLEKSGIIYLILQKTYKSLFILEFYPENERRKKIAKHLQKL